MLTFKRFILENFLLEDRLDFLKKQNPTIDTSHDMNAQHKNSSDIVDHFATNADPSTNKAHTGWILKQYKNKSIKQEDHPRIKSALENFGRYKSKLDKKDLNQYKSLGEVEDAVAPHVGSAASRKQEKKQQKDTGADLLYDSPTLSVHRLKTKDAACQYGKGTQWCTAAKNNNRFDEHNNKGPLYVVQHKDTGKKRQYHFETNQFKDEKDKSIPIHDEIKNNPELKNVKEFRNGSYGYLFARNKNEFDEKMNKSLEHDDPKVRRAAIQHPNATSAHIDKALNDEDPGVRRFAVKHPKATSAHIDKALDDEHPEVRLAAITHPKATSAQIDKALNDENKWVRFNAIRHPKLTSAHIDKALNDKDKNPDFRLSAINHPNATAENIDKALKDRNRYVRRAAINHPDATREHIYKALEDKHPDVRAEARKIKEERGW